MLDWAWASLGQFGAEKLAILCWQIWKVRNELVFDNVLIHPSLCVGRALDWLHEYQEAISRDSPPALNNKGVARWAPPLKE